MNTYEIRMYRVYSFEWQTIVKIEALCMKEAFEKLIEAYSLKGYEMHQNTLTNSSTNDTITAYRIA